MQRSFSTIEDERRKAIFLPHNAEKCDKIQPFYNRNSVNKEYKWTSWTWQKESTKKLEQTSLIIKKLGESS